MKKPIKCYFSTLNMLPKVAVRFSLKRLTQKWLSLQYTLFNDFQNLVNFGLNLKLEKQWNLFPSAKLAKLLDHLHVIGIHLFTRLAVAIPHLHFVEKGKKSFFQTWQNCAEVTPTFAKLSSIDCPS